MPIQITSTTSTSSIGGVLEEWKALVQRESQAAYRLTGVEVEADRMALSSSPVSVSVDLPGEQDVGIGRACALAWHRENIVAWCYQIIDNCELNRDLVYITMSFFDRYLSRLPVLDHMMIHLVAMTSLYLATKVHSIKKISIATIISLSGGLLSKDQVLGMEQSIMKSLEWYLNPPTPALFVTVLYPLMEKLTDDEDTMVEIKDLAIHLLELAVYDSCYFIDKPPSLMAHAAIMQAMNLLAIPMETQKRLEALPKSGCPFSIEDCSYRLHHIYCKKYERFDAQHSIHSPNSPSPTTVQW